MSHTATEPRRSWTSKLLIAAAVLLITLGAAWLIIDITGRRALRGAIALLVRQDAPVTFEDLVARRTKFPTEINAGLVLKEHKKAIEATVGGDDDDSLPIMTRRMSPFGDPWTAPMMADVSSYLAEHQDLLAQLRGIEKMPGGRCDLVYLLDNGDVYTPDPGEYAFVRSAAKLANLRALGFAAHGNLEAAQRFLLVSMHIARVLDEEPHFNLSLVRAACDAISISTLERMLSFSSFDSTALIHFDAELARGEESSSMWWGIQAERFWASRVLSWPGAYGGYTRFVGPGAPGMEIFPAPLMAGIICRARARLIEMFATITIALHSTTTALDAIKTYEAQRSPASLFSPFRLLPSLERPIILWVNTVAQSRCARTALAAERFRIDRGEWPSKLDLLVPDYLDTLPLDPFNDQPLLYKADDRMITIYSVGENKADDDGELEIDLERRRRPPDVGFRLLHTELRGLRLSKDEESSPP